MICKRFQTYAVQLTQQLLIIFILTALFCVMMRLSSLGGSSSKASVDKNYKYYTSVEVKNGDTLLDIASEYVTEEYGSLHEYVADLLVCCDPTFNDLNRDLGRHCSFLLRYP